VVLFFLCKKAPLLIQQAWGIEDGQPEPTAKKKPKLGFFAYIVDILKKSVTTVILFMKTIEVLYYVSYGFAAVLGVFLHPFFFAFHLSEIVLRYPVLKNVIRSVWEPREALFLSLVLFALGEYVFTLIAFTWFWDSYYGNCDNIVTCYFTTFDYSFKVSVFLKLFFLDM
jgi:inositol 1,4,5-triphosphate receptor type 1/inositol 1,4,5-triphosphate receptor type 3